MKKHQFIFLIISIIVITNEAKAIRDYSEPLAAYKSGNLWHFVGQKGQDLFPPKDILDVSGYNDGMYRVKIGNDSAESWYYLNNEGDFIKIPRCDDTYDFHNGRARLVVNTTLSKSGLMYGFIDKSGKLVIPFQFEDATDFSDGLAFVMNQKERGYIDTNGKMIFTFDGAGNEFSEGFADVNNFSFKKGYIDKTGQQVIDFQFDEAGPFSEGMAPYNRNGKFGFINKTGKSIIRNLFDNVQPYKEGRAFVAINDEKFKPVWGLLDKMGNKIADFIYTGQKNFSEGLAAVKKDNAWGFIDSTGATVLPFEYGLADCFWQGIAFVSTKDRTKMGYIDKTGKFIIELPKPEKVIDLRFNHWVR